VGHAGNRFHNRFCLGHACGQLCVPVPNRICSGEIAGGPQKLICDLIRTFAGVIAGIPQPADGC